MKKIITVLVIGILLFSCKKDGLKFTINGKVSDTSLSGVLQGAEVKLYSFALGSSAGVYEGNYTTDSQGKFSFELEREKYEKIQIIVNKSQYFEVIDDIPFSDLDTEEENTFNYSLEAKSWTRFVIRNQQPASEQDEFKLFKNSGKTDCEDCCDNGYSYYYGDIDTTIYCANGGNRYMSFFYWVNGNEDNGNDSVYNTPFDTVTYEFNY